MTRKIFNFLWIACLCLSLFVMQSEKLYAGSNEDLTAEKIVAAHVKSIGNPALLAKVQSRTFVGTSQVEFILGGTGTLNGNSMFVSQGPKLGIVLKYGDTNYPGEYFAYDGKDVTVGHIHPGQKSPIADFFYRFNKVMKGGFVGGSLSAAWPLLDIKNQNADMKYRKTKIDGQELYEIEYHPRDGFGDMKIRMFFDPATFQHVRTEYKVQHRDDATLGNDIAFDNMAPKAQLAAVGQARPDSFYILTEKFENYRKVGGMMLPHRYVIEYSVEGSGSFIAHWTLNVLKWGFNAPNLDQKIFQAQK